MKNMCKHANCPYAKNGTNDVCLFWCKGIVDSNVYTNISGLIQEYQKGCGKSQTSRKQCLDQVLTQYRQLPWMQAIEYAASAMCPFGGDRKHKHQQRIKLPALSQWVKTIKANHNAIKNCNDFTALYNLLKSIARGIKGISALTVYDTALRIASIKQYFPAVVYHHASAHAPGDDRREKCRNMKDFTILMQKLQPYEIENFLCSYHKQLTGHRNDVLV